MLEDIVKPQIFDTDRFGHINFIAPSIWFDRSRTTIYQALSPNLIPEEIGVVVLKSDIVYHKEMHWESEVRVRTWVSRIGHKSFTVTQEAWQNGICCATGNIILCGFNFEKRTSALLSEHIKSVINRFCE